MKLLHARKNRKYPFQKDSDMTKLKKKITKKPFSLPVKNSRKCPLPVKKSYGPKKEKSSLERKRERPILTKKISTKKWH